MASTDVSLAAFSSTTPPTRMSVSTPMAESTRPIVRMSRTSGTLLRMTGWSVRIEAHTSGREAFFAPEMRTVPSRALPPTIRIFSMLLPV